MLHVAFTSSAYGKCHILCNRVQMCTPSLFSLELSLVLYHPYPSTESSQQPASGVSSKIRKTLDSGITTLAACILQCQHTAEHNHGSRKCFLRQWGDTASPRERAAETNEYQQRRSKLPYLPVRCPYMTSWVWSRILTFHVLALFLSPVTDIFKNVGLFMRHIPFRTNVCF